MSYESQREREAQVLFDKAVEEHGRGNLTAAIVLLNRLLRDFQDAILVWNVRQWLGLCLVFSDEYERAIAQLELAYQEIDCSEDGQACFDILDNLANAHWRLDNFTASARYYQEAEQYLHHLEGGGWSSTLYLHHLGKGRCYMYTGKYKPALGEFDRARSELRLMTDAGESEFALF